MARKDPRGRKLKEGESYRSDGRYSYRYTNVYTGKRCNIYAPTLPELREKEKKLLQDMNAALLTEGSVKRLSVNELFERYMETKMLKEVTRVNYISTWNNLVKEQIGLMKVVQVKPSHVKLFYAKLSKDGYSHSTIKLIHNMLCPSFEMAVNDSLILKNPAKGGISDYGEPPKEKEALTPDQQEKLLSFIHDSNIYNVYYPMLIIMIGTGLRASELIGLTWNEVDMDRREICIAQQLVYKNYGDGCRFHASTPKTEAGVRTIPMSDDVFRAFLEQRKLNFLRGIPADVKVNGRSGFIFTTKTGRPLMPNGLNNALKNIVKAYNKSEQKAAVMEGRREELMPHISAHSLRHTGCTRMAEQGLDMKVVQYVMGHANVGVTMEVYNHITEQARVEKEIAKMNTVRVV